LQNFETICREPLDDTLFGKYGGEKEREGGQISVEPLGGVAIFLKSVEDLWDILIPQQVSSKPLKSKVKNLQGLPKTIKIY
jgi:hypothetical protein